MSLAHTKIRPPRPRHGLLLPRPQLIERLRRELQTQRVLLLCAPAGYGKTALLSQLFADEPPLAWVALDEGDDLGRLLECLFLALEPFDPPWRTAPEGLRDAARRGGAELIEVADAMLNALQACELERGRVVLDDVHHLVDPLSLQFLDRWLARLGSRWSLVLSSRHELPLRLARLRAAGELIDIGPEQLALTEDEVLRLAQGAGLDAAMASGLFQRSQGWPAGLRLALSAGPQARAGSIDRATFDYLADEVLDRLAAPLRDFLLRTSVLFELDAARCQALGEDANAAALLAEIERLSLFVTVVDLAPHTLRLHQLFRDMLQQRLRQRQPAQHRQLLERAAALEPDAVRRQGLLLAAGRPERAAELLLADGPWLMNQLGAQGLLELTTRFEPGFAENSPELHRVKALALWVMWEAEQAEWHQGRAQTLFAARGDETGLRTAQAHRAILLIAQGRLREAAELLHQLDPFATSGELRRVSLLARCWHALESCHFDAVAPMFEALVTELLQTPTVEAWYICTPPPRQLACRGMAPLAERWWRGALAVAADRPLPLAVMAQMAQAWNLFWQGHLPEATQGLEQAQADARWLGRHVIVRNHGLALQAMLDLVSGRPESALARMRQRLSEHVPGYGSWALWHADFFATRVAAAIGDQASLVEGLARLEALGTDLPDLCSAHRSQPLLGLQAQLAALQGRLDNAIAGWRALVAQGEASDLLGQVAESRLRLAAALIARGDLDGAAEVLQPALQCREPGGLLWALPLLRSAAQQPWGERLTPPVLARLRAWAKLGAPAEGAAPRSVSADDRLSQREAEVLAQIAQGASNKHIARALDLSPHTVKRHVANILDKLALNSRGEAAAWWSQRQALTKPGTGA